MTALFIALIIIGVVDVAVMLTIDTFIRLSGRKDPPVPGIWCGRRASWPPVSEGSRWSGGGIGEFGFSIVTVVMLGAAAALIYKVIVPLHAPALAEPAVRPGRPATGTSRLTPPYSLDKRRILDHDDRA